MEVDKNITPEQQWDKVKSLIFKGKTPKGIEELMQQGFKESKSEKEKWIKLSTFMIMIKLKSKQND